MSEKHFNARVRGWNNGEVTGQGWDVSLEPAAPENAIRDVLQSVRSRAGVRLLSALPSSLEEVGSFFPVHSLSQLSFFPHV